MITTSVHAPDTDPFPQIGDDILENNHRDNSLPTIVLYCEKPWTISEKLYTLQADDYHITY